jgi:hypothetical protein
MAGCARSRRLVMSRRDPRHRFVVAGLLVEPFPHPIEPFAETLIGHGDPDLQGKPALSFRDHQPGTRRHDRSSFVYGARKVSYVQAGVRSKPERKQVRKILR